MVDRAFHRDRFARAGGARRRRRSAAQNCRRRRATASGVRMLKDFAFHVVGTEDEARELDRGIAQVALAQARATGSWRTVVAPPGEHRPLHAVGNEVDRGAVAAPAMRWPTARDDRPDRLPAGRPELGRPGGRADEPPLPRPVRPAPDPASGRRGAGRRGALRHPRGRVPVLPARPRRVASARTASSGRTRQRRVRAVRLALAVRGLDRAAPPRGGLRAGHDAGHRGHRGGAPPGPRPRSRRASTGRPTTSCSTPRRCASRSTRPTTGTGRSTRACARSPGSSSGPGCR